MRPARRALCIAGLSGLGIAATVLLGCGGVWWKPGAGSAELARDRASCRESAGSRSGDFERCMREKGWWSSAFAAAERAADGAPPAVVESPSAAPSGPAERPGAPRGPGIWFRLGDSSPQRLARDQSQCRAEASAAGAASGVDAPSGPPRWGESPEFDACMRSRGWRGGPAR